MDAHTWLLLCLLLVGLIASIVGYVGCFSVVQNSMSSTGPVSWLCLEAGLSLIRLVIWAYNPTSDDAPPLEIILELDKAEPLPTCNKDNEEILQFKVLPLTRALDFLKIITSFAGLIKPFTHPDLSLYYTLTRKRPIKESVREYKEAVKTENYKVGERILYITVFDHKERTTRVYTQDNEMDIFYSTKSDAPFVDVGHFLLEVEIDAEIDAKGDPVCGDSNNLDSLRKHHRSILEHIQYRLGAGDVTKLYAIENSWTMKTEDTISALQKSREEGNRDIWKTVVEKGKEVERNEENLLLCDYFMHSSIESERQLLDEKRGKWIARRMEMIAEEMSQGEMGVEYRVDKQAIERKPATVSSEKINELLLWERRMIEKLQIYEVMEWEQLFWNKFMTFLVQIGYDRVEAKERLLREWRANCWKRLSPQIHALAENLDKDYYLNMLSKRWASSINEIFEGVENPNPILLSDLRGEIELKHSNDETRLRIEKEIEDTEFRLRRGSELGRFDQFWDDDALFRIRYSRSKWLSFHLSSRVPLEIYLHTLKGNKNISHITFSSFNTDSDLKAVICDLPRLTSISRLPSVTSIYGSSSGPPRAIDYDPLFIKSTNDDLIKFAKDVRPKLDPFSTYSSIDPGSKIYTDKLGGDARVLISFIAPTSGQSLTLRLKHSGTEDGPLEVTLGSTTIQLNPSSTSSLTIDDIILYPIPGPDRLSFVPGRNDIVIRFTVKSHSHVLHDIELLDGAALEDPRN